MCFQASGARFGRVHQGVNEWIQSGLEHKEATQLCPKLASIRLKMNFPLFASGNREMIIFICVLHIKQKLKGFHQIMSDYLTALMRLESSRKFDILWSQRWGTKHILDSLWYSRIRYGITSKCWRQFFFGFDTSLMKSVTEDFGSVANEAFKGLLSNTMKSANTRQKGKKKLCLVTFVKVTLSRLIAAILSVCVKSRLSKATLSLAGSVGPTWQDSERTTSGNKTFMEALWGHLGNAELCTTRTCSTMASSPCCSWSMIVLCL